jgi:hypothetical protein
VPTEPGAGTFTASRPCAAFSIDDARAAGLDVNGATGSPGRCAYKSKSGDEVAVVTIAEHVDAASAKVAFQAARAAVTSDDHATCVPASVGDQSARCAGDALTGTVVITRAGTSVVALSVLRPIGDEAVLRLAGVAVSHLPATR